MFDVAIVFEPLPTATQFVPFVAIAVPCVEKILVLPDTPVHFIPSVEYIIVFIPPEPTAVIIEPSDVILLHCVIKKLFVPVLIQVIPSYEYAIELIELVPTAIQIVPFQYTSLPDDVKIYAPKPYQLIPS